jgi:hypothetical protein
MPLVEFVSCFKKHVKTLKISLGHTFLPIELKVGVVPILVIQNYRKMQKRIKNWISTIASTPSFTLQSPYTPLVLIATTNYHLQCK